MKRKSGNPVSPVLGAEIEVLNNTLISKREAKRVLVDALGLSPDEQRQVRGAVNSYMAEGWPIPAQQGRSARLGEPFTEVGSLAARVTTHLARQVQAPRENGSKGGRPRKVRPGA